ncbi:hypothetical protein L3Q82_022992, partial [Scortum barcoo]
MKELAFIFLLLCDPGLAQRSPVTAGQGRYSLVHTARTVRKKKSDIYFINILYDVAGGSRTVRQFFCVDPGCAAHVMKVFCGDRLVTERTDLANCTGVPPLWTVCQARWSGLRFHRHRRPT